MSIPECLEAPLDAGITTCLIRMGYEEGDAVALTPTIYRLMELAYIAQEQLYTWADPRDDDPLSAAMQKDLCPKRTRALLGSILASPDYPQRWNGLVDDWGYKWRDYLQERVDNAA